MPIYKTDWSNTSTNPTNWLGERADESISQGSPIGLLLSLTQAQGVDSPVNNFATDYTKQSINASNWANDNVFANAILTQDDSGILDQSGRGILLP